MTTTNTNDRDITPFAVTNYRNRQQIFGIRRRDRRNATYIIGKSGMGKSTLMENMIYHDICAGEGVAVLDPHGDLVSRVLSFIPDHRIVDLVYFNPADSAYSLAFNVLEYKSTAQRNLIASELISVFKKIWTDSWGPRLEYILRNTILALLEVPGATLLDIQRMLVDAPFRKAVVGNLQDGQIKYFWLSEYESYPNNFRVEAISSIQNKVGQFISNPLIRAIVSQQQSAFDIQAIMDEGKILLVDLSKGKIGEDASSLLGALLLTQIELHALNRANQPEDSRRDFYLYCDEFHSFTTASFSSILSEARKYRLNLILAHQYIEQLDEGLRAAIFGNVGTIISFRVGARDAEYLSKEFYPVFNQEDLINLPQYHIALKLMVNGVATKPFNAETLPPQSQSVVSTQGEIHN